MPPRSSPVVPLPPVTLRLVGAPAMPAPPVTVRLRDASPPPGRGEPPWVAQSWDAATRELRRFLRTSWAFAARPRQTARLWSEGRFDALNPVAYLLNTVAVLGPWRALWQLILHVHEPLWMDVLWATAPFLGVVVSASLMHFLVTLAGGTRRLTSTWAISIYATGGFVAIFQLVSTPFVLLSDHIKTSQDWHDHWLAYVLGQLFAYPMLVWQSLALAGLHGLRARRVFLSQIVGLTVLVLLVALASFQLLFVVARLTHRGH